MKKNANLKTFLALCMIWLYCGVQKLKTPAKSCASTAGMDALIVQWLHQQLLIDNCHQQMLQSDVPTPSLEPGGCVAQSISVGIKTPGTSQVSVQI